MTAVLVALYWNAGVFEAADEAAEVPPGHAEATRKGLPPDRIIGRLQEATEPAGGLEEKLPVVGHGYAECSSTSSTYRRAAVARLW